MAVKGQLQSLGLEDLLAADLAAQGPGRLTLRCGALHACVYVTREGIYVLEPDVLDPQAVVRAAVHRGLVSEPAVSAMYKRNLNGAELLDALLQEGQFPEHAFMEICAASAEDTVLDLMLWEEGQFHFEVGEHDDSRAGLQGRLLVDPKGLLERALPRIDERVEIAETLGTHALLFQARVGELPPLASPDDVLHGVYARLDGETVVSEIALYMGVGRFDVLRAVRRLFGAGLVRLPPGDELLAQVNRRIETHQYPIARALCLQWMEAAPSEPGPLKKLASVADAAGNRLAALDALCALGGMHVEAGNPGEAIEIFKRAMRRSPADEVVLAGLRVAAEAAGDGSAYADSTMLTAQAALDENGVDAALEALRPFIEQNPDHVPAHLLRARALVMAEDREGLLAEAMVVGEALSRVGCKSRENRNAAAFFHEAIAEVAPERGDLLERFRQLHASPLHGFRRVALGIALLLIVAGAGFYLWPASAASLLADARSAVERGETEQARDLIVKLVDAFPDSQEAEEAFALQRRIMGPAKQPDALSRKTQQLKTEIDKLVPAFLAALPGLPSPEPQEAVLALVRRLEEPATKQLRKRTLRPGRDGMRAIARKLLADAQSRARLLNEIVGVQERMTGEPRELSLFLERASAMRDPAYLAALESTSHLLARIAGMLGDEGVASLSSELARAVTALMHAGEYYDANIAASRLSLATMRVDEADRKCREQAPKLMVSGHLDRADALYRALELLIVEYDTDETYKRLMETVRRRQIPQFLRDRRSQIADIKRRLAHARAAEEKGDLETAVRGYTALVREYWLIRFEQVFTMPVRVRTIPPGAQVACDGKAAGRSPAVVRYAWGGKSSVDVAAPGYAPERVELRTAEDRPESEITVRLALAPIWAAGVSQRIAAAPMVVDGHVLFADRGGRVTLYDRNDGSVRWAEDHRTLEGVKSRPAYAGRWIYLACVDGRVLLLDPATGKRRHDLRVGRPHGDMAALRDIAAVATEDSRVVAMRGESTAWELPLTHYVTAGVMSAHDALWVGTAGGQVVRIDPSGRHRVVRVAGPNVAVLSLSPAPGGILATTSTGGLVSVAPQGTVRWRRAGAGDPVGAPAETGGAAAFVDRTGVLHLFSASDGSPRETVALGATGSHGVVATRSALVVALDDGRLWAYEPGTKQVVLDRKVDTKARFRPETLGSDRIAFGAKGPSVRVTAPPATTR